VASRIVVVDPRAQPRDLANQHINFERMHGATGG
jgi:hypothetical protein